ncbi:unnamed protein product [Coregonus sp. 'balchen']|nr:unnamed protein product [Coregonus sp. 'balchen']
MAAAMVEMDGSIMEGRANFESICRTELHQRRIHQNKQNSRRPQHLSGLELVRDICCGNLEGGSVGSTEVSLPCALYADGPSELCLKGGTNADMAPQIDYTIKVFKPIVEKFGVHFNCDLRMRGYYPKGGGEVVAKVSPVSELSPVNMTERGTISKIYGRSFVAGVLPYKLAKDMATTATRVIRREIKDLYINIQTLAGEGHGLIIAESSTGCIFAGSALGKKGVYPDKVGFEAAEMLLRNIRHNGCVDEFLQDQLILFMALANGTSRIRTGPVTLHTKTAIHVAEQLTQAKFTVTKADDENASNDTYIIECQGVGVTNPHF